MNLFLARLTGKIMSSDQFEKHIRQLLEDHRRYTIIEQSDELKEYRQLEQIIGDVRFQETKKEYKTKNYKDTVEYKNYSDFLALQKDPVVQKYLHAVTDEERNTVVGAIAVKNYIQLKSIVDEAGFESKRAFWENPNRWLQTEEYRKEMRLEQLKKNPDIQFYLNADPEKFRALSNLKETFKAPFHDGRLDSNMFGTGFYIQDKSMRRDFSLISEAQAYTGEKNINILNDVLSIITKREDTEALVWDAKKGFVMHPFHYTSSIINSGDSFQQADGLYMAKVRASGKCHSAICLMTEDEKTAIELYHYNGKNIVVGYKNAKDEEEEVIRGLKPQDWHTFSVLVDEKKMVFFLNERTILETENPVPGQKLHFSIRSFAPANHGAEGRIDVDWVRGFVVK